jgi:glutathione S-transferase
MAGEAKLRETTGQFAVGDRVGLADICLVPQLYNARRFDVDLRSFPGIGSVDASARALPAFVAAAPENQLDAE